MSTGFEVLTMEQMYEADRLAIKLGISGLELMENAGQGAVAYIEQGWDICPVIILCGPGNNGGDGYVMARALQKAGWPVRVYTYGDPDKLTGDARAMADLYSGESAPLTQMILDDADGLIVDALFGAGFKGELPKEVRETFEKVDTTGIPVVAIDVPSGVNGTTGSVSPGALSACLTVSFFRPKPGHLLYPAREKTGALEIVDIGIPDAVLEKIDHSTNVSDPDLWSDYLSLPSETGHKYSRGHAAVVGGGISSSGAARIASRCALRAGAGAVTVVSPPSALMLYATTLEAVMVKALEEGAFSNWLREKRIGTVLIGPGNGVHERTKKMAETALAGPGTIILDADALTVFKEDPDSLFKCIKEKESGFVILTPHEAEFSRLFDLKGSSLERARQAAGLSGAIILLKGASTIIAHPDGRTIINNHAPPWLATAGSGDALAGIIAGLVSAGGDPFLMTAAAAWMHGQAAYAFGPGLIAEDIEGEIPTIFQDLM